MKQTKLSTLATKPTSGRIKCFRGYSYAVFNMKPLLTCRALHLDHGTPTMLRHTAGAVYRHS